MYYAYLVDHPSKTSICFYTFWYVNEYKQTYNETVKQINSRNLNNSNYLFNYSASMEDIYKHIFKAKANIFCEHLLSQN